MQHHNPAQTAESGAALAPLGKVERQQLAILCRRAWIHLGQPGASFDAWRRSQIMQIVERAGLRYCRHEDYNYIKAHMLTVLGSESGANQALLRAASERRRQALYRLRKECREATAVGNPVAYIQAIARNKFKTQQIEELAANQIWQLIFSLRNAQKRKARLS